MGVSEATYKRVALEDREGHWELVDGRLRQKPDMTTEHAGVIDSLYHQITTQLDRSRFRMRADGGRLRNIGRDTPGASRRNYFEPDLCVIYREAELRLRARPGTFEVYDEPMPLVVEVWSPSTGEYDVEEKLKEYQRRGDLEIWRLHPYERTLTAWRKQPDDTYTETLYRGGTIELAAVPNVTIDIDSLWD